MQQFSQPTHLKKDTSGVILAGLIVLALPIIAIGYQYNKLTTGTPLKLSVERALLDNSGLHPKLNLTTTLNHISTTKLTGDNSFVVGDTAYVYMSQGPNDIWYPYTISKNKPDPGCRDTACLVVSGQVKDIKRDSMRLFYNFETFMVPQNTIIENNVDNRDRSEIVVMVDDAGHSTLRSLRLGDQYIDQRNLLKSTLPGFKSMGAKIAPAINPPK